MSDVEDHTDVAVGINEYNETSVEDYMDEEEAIPYDEDAIPPDYASDDVGDVQSYR